MSVKNVSAHYVGDAVIVDFQLENKSKKNITDLSLSVEGKDDNTIWYHFDDNFISTGEGQPFMSYLNDFTPTIQRSGDNLLLSFSVTNNTGVDLADTHLYVSHLDNGNGVNFNADLFVEDVKQANYFMDITINAGETRRLNIYVPNFFKYQARCVNATINMTSKSYYFANKNLFLVSIDQ